MKDLAIAIEKILSDADALIRRRIKALGVRPLTSSLLWQGCTSAPRAYWILQRDQGHDWA